MNRSCISTKILDALLNKYERSSAYREDTTPTRRILLDLYNDGRSDFPDYDIEKSDKRLAVNRTVMDLAANDIIGYEWMRGEKDHILSRIWLLPVNLPLAYKAADRIPQSETATQVLTELHATLAQTAAPWAHAYLQDLICETIAKRKTPATLPTDPRDRADLLAGIVAAANLSPGECTERVLSLQIYGDSKRFEHAIKPRLLSILRKHQDHDDDTPDDDLLRQIGITRYPEQFEFCGPLTAAYPLGAVDFAPITGGCVLYSSDFFSENRDGVHKLPLTLAPETTTILSIENRANYLDYIQNKNDNELVLYHGGQFSPRKQLFFQAIAAQMNGKMKWYHWSDMDYGGFLMLSRLRREIRPDVLSYRMGIDDLERYMLYTAPISEAYKTRLETLLTRPELSDSHACIRLMIDKKIRLEQEAMLIKKEQSQ